MGVFAQRGRGRDMKRGHAARLGDRVVVVPLVNAERVTPLSEGFQAVVWHLIVSHPLLKTNDMKWESVK